MKRIRNLILCAFALALIVALCPDDRQRRRPVWLRRLVGH